MERSVKIYVAGHTGLVGSALTRALASAGYKNLLVRTKEELDLTNQSAVRSFLTQERPERVFLAAAKVGGIVANRDTPAEFIRDNLVIETNIIHESYTAGVKKLLFLGSSCIYPKLAPQPIKEESLLTGPLEETNRAYAIAKIAGIELCRSYRAQYGAHFISVMPTNLYGPHDNFDLGTAHVIPALLRKFHEAKESGAPGVNVWGTGTPRREFLHVDDLADACLFLMEHYDEESIINIGTGEDLSIRELAELIQKIVNYGGEIAWDTEKPDGTPQKLLDVSRIRGLGWKHRSTLEAGLRQTYDWYEGSQKSIKSIKSGKSKAI